MKNDMVSRCQSLKYSQTRCHACAEGDCLYAALKVGQALFERLAIGIVDPAIEVVAENSPSGSRSNVVEV